jgi:Conserved TM helix
MTPTLGEIKMDLSVFSTAMQNALGAQLPNILGAVAILIVGYIFALVARAAVHKMLSMLRVNSVVGQSAGKPIDIEGSVALAAFWFVLLVTLLGVFNSLKLDQLSGPVAGMIAQIMTYVPHLLAGTMLLLLAWIAATLVRKIANSALKATQWDEMLTEHAGMSPLGDNVGNILFWLVILLFLPAVLGVLELEGMLDPMRSMVNDILAMLPRLLASMLILVAGWVVAKVLRGLVSNLLATMGADKLAEQAGMKDPFEISRLVGTLVFILILVPAMIAAIDALNITAISGPATNMLDMMMTAIPNIFAAALILFITWFVSRFVAALSTALLSNLGVNSLPEKAGLQHLFSDKCKVTDLVSRIIVFFAMLFATVEAAHRLDFPKVQELLGAFIKFGGDILLGVAILTVGFWLANLAYQAILKSNEGKAVGVAAIARFAILGLVLAMGLSAMGIADQIVNTAFALVFGAIAVAIAIAFGLGGREAAGKQMEYWLAKLRKDNG